MAGAQAGLTPEMDLHLPDTLYPTVLSSGLVWGLFLSAIGLALVLSALVARNRKPWVGFVSFVPILGGTLTVTILISMVLAFVLHH